MVIFVSHLSRRAARCAGGPERGGRSNPRLCLAGRRNALSDARPRGVIDQRWFGPGSWLCPYAGLQRSAQTQALGDGGPSGTLVDQRSVMWMEVARRWLDMTSFR